MDISAPEILHAFESEIARELIGDKYVNGVIIPYQYPTYQLKQA